MQLIWSGLLLLLLAFGLGEAMSHVYVTGAAPSVSSCGADPVVSGNDKAGTISVGAGVVTACTLTFAAAWATAPHCVVTTNVAAVSAGLTTLNASTMASGLSASLGGGKIYYHCMGTQ